jgi:hypothetical protein
MALIYVSGWSFATGPFNEQLMYGVITGTIAYVAAGAYALEAQWPSIPWAALPRCRHRVGVATDLGWTLSLRSALRWSATIPAPVRDSRAGCAGDFRVPASRSRLGWFGAVVPRRRG